MRSTNSNVSHIVAKVDGALQINHLYRDVSCATWGTSLAGVATPNLVPSLIPKLTTTPLTPALSVLVAIVKWLTI